MNKKYMLILAFLLLALVGWVAFGYFAVRNIEEPQYVVEEVKDGYEIRNYETYIIARTLVKGKSEDALNEGFRVIADYIFGNNTKNDSIAMTTPVAQEKTPEPIAMTVPVAQERGEEAGEFYVSFTMPSKYSMETLPLPNNKLVEIVEVPSEKMAVLRFSGFTSEAKLLAKEKELQAMLERDGFEVLGQAKRAYYNPPFTPPFMKRNEVIFNIK